MGCRLKCLESTDQGLRIERLFVFLPRCHLRECSGRHLEEVDSVTQAPSLLNYSRDMLKAVVCVLDKVDRRRSSAKCRDVGENLQESKVSVLLH